MRSIFNERPLARIVVGALFIAVAFGASAGDYANSSHGPGKVTTTATVVSYDVEEYHSKKTQQYKSYLRYKPTVQYEHDGEDVEAVAVDYLYDKPANGQTVEVLFNSSDPSRTTQVQFDDDWRFAWKLAVFGGIGLCVLGSGIASLAVRRRSYGSKPASNENSRWDGQGNWSSSSNDNGHSITPSEMMRSLSEGVSSNRSNGWKR